MSFEKGPIQDFIGRGLIFPIKLVKGRPELSTGFDLIKSSLAIILSWPYGQRYFLCEFGSRLEDLLEEPNDEALDILIENYVIDAINTWEKRIELQDVIILKPTPSSITITIKYRIINSKKEDVFIYPFYNKIIY